MQINSPMRFSMLSGSYMTKFRVEVKQCLFGREGGVGLNVAQLTIMEPFHGVLVFFNTTRKVKEKKKETRYNFYRE